MSKDRDVVQMTIRLDPHFHKVCLKLADEYGQTLAEWIRRAMKEKVERDSGSKEEAVSRDEIKDIVRDMIREEIGNKSIGSIKSKKEQLKQRL